MNEKEFRDLWYEKSIKEITEITGLSNYLITREAKRLGLPNKRQMNRYHKILGSIDMDKKEKKTGLKVVKTI